ncbi:signal peptidase I [Nakamurella lactea]|uniref:signal peptidase I n=1 Tax=Nakamurella lactea TaxID=459515 RepID=UPI000429171F|nr:signal peptidase I [Nakamurella lactea]
MHRKRRGRRVTWTFVILGFLGVLVAGLAFWQAGYRPYVVHTGSMAPTYRPGDLVIDRPAARSYQVGEVITFRYSADPNALVTHRVTEVTANGSIHTKGDANRTADSWTIRPGLVVGSVATSIPRLGYVVVFLQQPTGLAALLVAAIAAYLLWGLFFPPAPTTSALFAPAGPSTNAARIAPKAVPAVAASPTAADPAADYRTPTLSLVHSGGFPGIRPSVMDNS